MGLHNTLRFVFSLPASPMWPALKLKTDIKMLTLIRINPKRFDLHAILEVFHHSQAFRVLSLGEC